MQNDKKQHTTIKGLAEDDRPREKALEKGIGSLSNAEIIAILIGSGSREQSAIALAQEILNTYKNDFNELGRQGIKDLMRFKGIGEAKAITIVAALELGRRRKDAAKSERIKIQGSTDAYKVLAPLIMDKNHEEFWIILLNRANMILDTKKISSGGVSGTVVDPKLIFKEALLGNASSIILAHNHPSGNLQPSQADIELTKKMKAAGNSMDMPILDHLIITDNGYYSFLDEGYL